MSQSNYNSKTIKEMVVENINIDTFLPSIQRKFVWKTDEIIKLMNSIMLGYPIGTFLFWKISREKARKELVLYEFIKHYHERDTLENEKVDKRLKTNRINVVLDGQQRLTSLYSSLQGTLSYHKPGTKWKEDKSYEKKELYFNLNTDTDKLIEEDGFAFLSEDDIEKQKGMEEKNWYKVSDILHIKDIEDEKENFNNKMARKNLEKLYKNFCENGMLNYFEVKDKELDEVLEIFVRVNSGGVVLSKTDLLFSTIVSKWQGAREAFVDLLKSINNIKNSRNIFKFDNDWLMNTCLFLLDKPLVLQVKNLSDSVEKIEEDFEKIKLSIQETVNRLFKWGFCSDNITSYNAIIPIVYYFYKNNNKANKDVEDSMKKYFIISQLKKIYGGSSTTTLTSIRKELQEENSFDIDKLNNTKDVNFDFTDTDIEELFEIEKGAYTFMILSLLQSHLDLNATTFDQDHLHPYSKFKKVFSDKDILHRANTVVNLQILKDTENRGVKNDGDFETWYAKEENKNMALSIPRNVSHKFDDFEKFFEKRKELLKQELEKILPKVKNDK